MIGCADLKYPINAWYKREGDTLTIGCENKDLSWTLRCDGHQWQGTLGNCTDQGMLMSFSLHYALVHIPQGTFKSQNLILLC